VRLPNTQGGFRLAKHVGSADESDRDFHGDYLAYARKANLVKAAAALSALGGISRLAWRVREAFQESTRVGIQALEFNGWALVAVGVLIVMALLGVGLPAVIRAAILRRRNPAADLYSLQLIPGFWGRLAVVDPDHDPGKRLPFATLSLDGTSATIWRGILHPRVVATLPLDQLAAVTSKDAHGLSFQRRVLVLTFQLGPATEELPLAIRRVSLMGSWRVSEETQARIVEQLSRTNVTLGSESARAA
jgi:hypothetical protein